MKADLFTLAIAMLLTNLLFSNSLNATGDPEVLQFKKSIDHNFKMVDDSKVFNICGLTPGHNYYGFAYDDRFDSNCGYRFFINGVELNSLTFDAKSECVEITLQKSDCKTNEVVYPRFALTSANKGDDEEKVAIVTYDESLGGFELVNDKFLDNGCFDVISSSIRTGGSVGFFEGGTNSIGIENGVVLANAPLNQLQGGNGFSGDGGALGTPGDAHLDFINDTGTADASFIEFEFVPSASVVEFKYVFASDEYCDFAYVGTRYVDVFGFFLSGPNINGTITADNSINIAYVPNPNDPSGLTPLYDDQGEPLPVNVRNVNHTNNSQYYRSNAAVLQDVACDAGILVGNQGGQPIATTDIIWDGWTTQFTAAFSGLMPCETYKIKLAVADSGDRIYGSAVYLAGNSFQAGNAPLNPEDFQVVFEETGSNYVYEGCGSQTGFIDIYYSDPNHVNAGFVTLPSSVVGTATRNKDYSIGFNNNIIAGPFFFPGYIHQEIVTILPDTIYEPDEFVEIEVDFPCDCQNTTIDFTIIDIPDMEVSGLEDDIFCSAQEFIATPTVSGGMPEASIEADDHPFSNYTFQWFGPDGFNSTDRQLRVTPPEDSGIYEYYFIASDECGHVVFDTARVTIIGEPAALISGTGSVCDESPNTDLEISLTGPGPWDVVYSIDGVEQPPIEVTENEFMLTTSDLGSYELVSVVSNDCPGEVSGLAQVVPTVFTFETDPTDASCNGLADGSASVSITGGFGTYSYLWEDGQTTQLAEDLGEGTYSVTVTDQSGCTSATTATVSQPTEVQASAVELTGTTCAQPEIGSADLSVEGGTAPYTFEWDNGSEDEDPESLTAGDYEVIVSDFNSCTTTATVSITADTDTPAAAADVTQQITCSTTQVQLDGLGSTEGTNITYEWSSSDGTIDSGNDSLNPTVSSIGTYEILVTNTDNGCTNSTTIEVTNNISLPTADPGTAGSLTCTETTVTLNGSGSVSSDGSTLNYEWIDPSTSSVGSSAELSATSAGTYTLIVTNSENGCTDSETISIAENADLPAIDAGTTAELDCAIEMVNLDGSGSDSGTNITYAWSTDVGAINGDNTVVNPEVTAPGVYTLVVTNTDNNCSSTATVTITEDITPPTVGFTPAPVLSCAETSISLNGDGSDTGGNYNYEWTTDDGSFVTGENTLTPEINEAGTYTLIVTNTDNGCTAEDDLIVQADENTPDAAASVVDVLTCTDESVSLSGNGSSTGGSITYEWSTSGGSIVSGNNDINPVVNQPGTYQILVTNTDNGCTNTQTVNVLQDIENPVANPGTADILSCTETSVTLDASGSTGNSTLNYQWTGPNGASGNSASLTASDAGVYTLLVTNSENGCTNSETITVTEDVNLPAANAGVTAELTCAVESLILDGTGSDTGDDYSYAWSTGDGTISGDATIINPEITAPGTYQIVVTNAITGCTNEATVDITQDINPPVVEAGVTQILSCAIESLNLDGAGSDTGGNITYEWTTANGNILNGNTALTPEVNAPGIYDLIVTNNTNGCTNIDMVEIEQDLNAPISDAGDATTLNCIVEETQLDGSGSTTGGNITFAWSTDDGNITTGDDSLTPTVDAPGIYTLTVTNMDNNCETLSTVTIPEDIENPEADAGEVQELNCTILDVEIGGMNTSTGDNFSYAWSNASTTATTSVSESGTYELIVTNTENGCTDISTVDISQDITDPEADAGPTNTITCQQTTIELNGGASSTGGEFEYSWTTSDGNIDSGESSLNPIIDEPGTYDLLVTNTANNCTSTAFVLIDIDADFPDITIADAAVLDCELISTTLSGLGSAEGDDVTYSWSTADGNITSGDDSLEPTINEPGTYELQVSNDATGCTSIEEILVTQDIVDPIALTGDNQVLSCAVESLMLSGDGSSAGPNFTYEWTTESGNILGGASSLSPEVDQPALYTIIVTNTANNCTDSEVVEVLLDENAPIASAGEAATLNCDVEQIVLDGNDSSQNGNLTYEWTTEDGIIVDGGDSLEPTVNEPGTYILTVIDQDNGCETSNSVIIDQDIELPTVAPGEAGILNCTVTDMLLNATMSSTGDNFMYEWSTTDGSIVSDGNTLNPLIEDPGTYTLLITNTENNCIASESILITEDVVAPEAMVAAPAILTCTNELFNLDGGNSSTGAIFEYSWITDGNIITGETTLNPEIDAPGDYTLVVTNTENNCVTTVSVEVDQDVDLPVVAIANPTILTCDVIDLPLNGTGSEVGSDIVYTWSTPDGAILDGANTIEATINEPGTYILNVLNSATGCDDEMEVIVDQDIEAPLAEAGETQEVTCGDPEIAINGTGSSEGSEFEYTWTTPDGNIVNGDNTLEITLDQPGTYTIEVLNETNGCISFDEVLITSNDVFPTASIDDADILNCAVSETILNGNASGGTNLTFAWTTPDGNIVDGDDTANPTVNDPGTYNLAVTNIDNGCITNIPVIVSEDIELPDVDAGQSVELICASPELSLSGTGSNGSAFSYEWTTPDGSILNGNTTLSPLVNEAGTYLLSVFNANNQCENSDVVEVTSNIYDLSITPNTDQPLCFGDMGTIYVDAINNGLAPYEYTLNGNAISEQELFAGLDVLENNYEIDIIDANGCTGSESYSVVQPAEIYIDTDVQVDIAIGEMGELIAETNVPENEIQSITWSPAQDLSCVDCLTPITSSVDDVLYTVTIINQNGCVDEAQVQLRVDRTINIFVPSGFSPDNNGNNDMFYLQSQEGAVLNITNFQVFDRWGSHIFSKTNIQPNDPSEGWDGTYLGKSLNPAVFVYWIEVELIDGRKEILKGDVTLYKGTR